MLRLQSVPRSHVLIAPSHLHLTRTRLILLISLLPVLTCLFVAATPTYAAVPLWLPTPPGETWKIIQGYACGSHNGWDRYSLDLVNSNGRTQGAPVRAAADGQIWSWTAKSGTLILSHGDGFYTMYTHMDSAVTTQLNTFVSRGTVIGAAGARAANGLSHLHFTAFTGTGMAAAHRQSVPLAFAEGYHLPDVGGCNQHAGELLTAGGDPIPPEVHFNTDAEPQRWYNADKRVEFDISGSTSGFSQSWEDIPAESTPQFTYADAGFMQLATAGEGLHTVEVRVWDISGQSTSTTYGPIGYDVTPPQNVLPSDEELTIAAGKAEPLMWAAAADNASGVAGYRIYVGSDQNGTSDWFSPAPQVASPALTPGTYVLRVQPLDYAGNAGEWTTVLELNVK